MVEKYVLIKNKSQNVPEIQPEESNSEVNDLVESRASHVAAKETKMRTDLQACVPPASPAGLHKVRYPGNGVTRQTQIWQPILTWAYGPASQIKQSASLMTACYQPASITTASQQNINHPDCSLLAYQLPA
jgi:hypothetical protein